MPAEAGSVFSVGGEGLPAGAGNNEMLCHWEIKKDKSGVRLLLAYSAYRSEQKLVE